MSDHLRHPFDDDALDGYWDALVRGQQPSVPLPPDVIQALRRLSSIDPAPQSSTVRERAWAETWKRMQPKQSEQESASIHAAPISLNHRQPQSIPLPPRPEKVRAAPSPGRLDRKWTIVAALIAATLLAFMVYRYFGPIGSDPDNGPVIPAAVIQEATSIPAPLGEHKITIDLPASMVHSTGAISAGFDYTEFPMNLTFTYDGHCCPGPWVEYVFTGQLTVHSNTPMTIFRADGESEAIPAGLEVTLLAGDAFLAENDAQLVATNKGEEWAQLLGWVLVNEDGFQGHDVGGFAAALDADLELEMIVTPGSGQVVVTRYNTLDQVPDPEPNSYQFVLQAYHAANGTQTFSSTLVDMQASPIPTDSTDGFYVLDFFMSPPGTATPEASVDA